ncbi:MAG: mRNA surveillance protein pelota [Candidatus Micrarchaeia archaeon]
MRILGFNSATNTLRLVPETFDDLYLLARIISAGDEAEARTYRRFKPNENKEGEQKEVVIKIGVEKVEIDKNAARLRLTGKIISGRPEQYIALGSYHTLNIAQGDRLEIAKQEWPGYMRDMLKEAVEAAKKPRLGIVAIDEEKATIAYVRGYGIDIVAEIYSKLSKKMKQSEYEREKNKFFDAVIGKINTMQVDTVIVAGPGFTKDDLKQYISANRIETSKKLAWASASDAERSGIKEALQSEEVAKLLEHDKIKLEFYYLNMLLRGLASGASFAGKGRVEQALEEYNAGIVLVNDSAINDPEIRRLLNKAYEQHAKIEIFNAEDDAGMQLKGLGDIAAIGKQLLR